METSPRRLALRGRLSTRRGELESAPAPGRATQPLLMHKSDHAASLGDPAGTLAPQRQSQVLRAISRAYVVCFHQLQAHARSLLTHLASWTLLSVGQASLASALAVHTLPPSSPAGLASRVFSVTRILTDL